ncbi:MAG: site-specific integrase, partial [Planctomycetota bacterium]|nr:site-specific integrase [Planctomycetota bacterium]
TTHPRPGEGVVAHTPPPKEGVRRLIEELSDLPQQADREIQDLARSALAKRRQVKVEGIAWPHGCLHDFRRTWCTWTADVVKMSTLQKWAGHEDIATTAIYYCETTDDEAQRVRKALSMAASA